MGLLNNLVIPFCMMHFLVLVQCIDRPVIGILMQKSDPKRNDSDYVVFANYVKALEGSGAFVVPVSTNMDISYYRKILSRINGIVFPGGSANLLDPTDIGRSSEMIYELAEEMNEQGVNFPILGICQGLQLLMKASAGAMPLLSRCKGLTNIGLKLKFIMKPPRTDLFRNAPEEVIQILKNEPVTANAYKFCLTPKTLKANNLTSAWRVISTDRDDNGLRFITIMEHTRYPFVGLQFHPEKTLYDMAKGFKFPTDRHAIVANRWFYDWLVEESRKSVNRFPKGELMEHVMENYRPTFEFERGLGAMLKYFFLTSGSESAIPHID